MFDIATAASPTLSTPTQAFSVSEINTLIADLLAAGMPAHLWVEGEISNLSVAASGHRYLSLKDSGSAIGCALFRGSAQRIAAAVLNNLKNGDKVIVKANLSVYKPRGNYQLIINDIEPAGFGALAKAFTELKAKLENAGLTAAGRKRSIPTWAGHIAVITSETGAAIRDVLTTLKRRAPFIPITVYPTLVQGDQAARQLVQALQQANDDALNNHRDNGGDNGVILLVRGGGSLEDLMAFNDESVAMAVVNSTLPVVTGVGHETDFTIVDFVSDYRAPTPTAAAEIVSPDKVMLLQALNKQKARLYRNLQLHHQQRRQRVLSLLKRLQVQHPIRQLQQQSQRLDELTTRLQRGVTRLQQQRQQQLNHCHKQLLTKNPKQALTQSQAQLSRLESHLFLLMQQQLESKKQRLMTAQRGVGEFKARFQSRQQQLKGLQARLTLLSPLGVLQRGYAVSFDEKGQLLRSIEQVQRGVKIHVRLADGEFSAIVEDKRQ